MDTYMKNLRNYVQEHKIIFDEDSPQPCLDSLWWHYEAHHSQDPPDIKDGFKHLRQCLESLPIEDSDAVFADVGCLCAEHDRIAFTAGVRLGVQLMMELTETYFIKHEKQPHKS